MSTIWIDFENTPHVPFFAPIIQRLERDGHRCILTSRDFGQTNALVARYGLSATSIGGEYGSATLRKAIGLLARALALRRFINGNSIDLAVGHGSRGLLIASKLLGIPSLTLYDYEGASVGLFNKLSTRVMTPEVVGNILLATNRISASKLLTYGGLKEEVYAFGFSPDPGIYHTLSLDPEKIIVTIRPPSDTAHYRSKDSDKLFGDILKTLRARSDIQIVISARTMEQRARLKSRYGAENNIRIPEHAFDGLNLLYHSDLLIGGGGTMNREAAVLGVPVLSIFKGAQGAVDAELIRSGRMTEISDAEQILQFLKKRDKAMFATSELTLTAIVDAIERLSKGRI